jgi:DNA invertase Pin-like site-specific DNA recombinase
MAARHSIATPTARAVAYIRRSTHKQEKSLADQRREIEAYADREGFVIVRWFEDDGISGDATDKRNGFQAMHAKACNGRDFDVILCWDQDRFGRFNSIEAGYWIHPLMKAGVRLVTVTEGPINWDDFSGRIVHAVKQEGKHQFLVDLSRNVARGQITAVAQGWITGRAAPYGFDRMLVDEAGNHKQRVHNCEPVAKPRSWHVTLVIADNPEVVRVAKWLFETYVNEDVGLRELVNRLNGQGIPGPRGGPWHLGTVREILKNETYAGDFIWPKRSLGKYHRISAGEIKPRNGSTAVKHTDHAERVHHEGMFPALVDRETFNRVQAKLTERKKRTTPHKAKNGDDYLLSGLVHCEHCGAKMYGARSNATKNGKKYSYPRYVCSTYHTKGRHLCNHNTVDQGKLLAAIVTKLRQTVLAGGGVEQVASRVAAMLKKQLSAAGGESEGLRSRLAELDKQVAQGTKRLLAAPDDVADLLAAELSNLRRERDHLAERLKQSAPAPVDVEAQAEALAQRLWTFTEEVAKATPARQRELLRRVVGKISLRFRQTKWGRKSVSRFDGGTVDLRPHSDLYSLVSRGDWPSFERVVATVVDAALSPNAETIVAHRVVRLSA